MIAMQIQEKRTFNRIPFAFNDNIIGVFTYLGKRDKIEAHILNFSMQGLYFSLKSSEKFHPKINDKLVLIEIKAPHSNNFIMNIELHIRRILDHSEFEHVGYGCHFDSFPESSKKQYRRFLEIWFLERR